MTREQENTLASKWAIDNQGMSWLDFKETAQQAVSLNGAFVVRWCGMWLCIEEDGYCHT